MFNNKFSKAPLLDPTHPDQDKYINRVRKLAKNIGYSVLAATGITVLMMHEAGSVQANTPLTKYPGTLVEGDIKIAGGNALRSFPSLEREGDNQLPSSENVIKTIPIDEELDSRVGVLYTDSNNQQWIGVPYGNGTNSAWVDVSILDAGPGLQVTIDGESTIGYTPSNNKSLVTKGDNLYVNYGSDLKIVKQAEFVIPTN